MKIVSEVEVTVCMSPRQIIAIFACRACEIEHGGD